MAKDRLNDLSELLSAYLDGELDEPTRAQVVAYLDRDPDSVRLLNELRDTRSMLQDLPHQSAPAGFSESVVSAVERQALLGGEPDTTARMSTHRRWGPIRSAASIALLVGVAGSWIYWQSDRREFADLALRGAAGPDTITGRATGDSVELKDGLAMADGLAAEPIHREESPTRFKKGPRGKAAAPVGRSADLRGMVVQSAETEVAQQQRQSIAEGDLITQAGIFEDYEVVALGVELETSTVFSPAARAEQVDFRLAGQLRGSRLGGAVRADFMRRLQANETAASLASHDFSNESNMLTLSFSSDAQRDKFTQKFEVYLEDNDFLSAADPLERIQVVNPLTQNVLLRGQEGLNYAEPSSEQMLLSAAPEVLEGLLDRYAETTGDLEHTTNIQLQMGELKVEGLESTRRIVRAMAVPELQRRVLGKDERAGDSVQETTADQDEHRTAEQWRGHYARLGLAARMQVAQVRDAEERAADESTSLVQTEDKSGLVAGGAHGKKTGPEVTSDQSPKHKESEEDTPALKREADREEQAVDAGQQDQREAGVKSKKRRAQSAKGMPADKIELFGGVDKSPPAPDSADGGSRGGSGGGRAGTLKRPTSHGPSRPIGRASNLTFVLRLRTVPPPEPEPTPEMGPPAPPSESDELEE